MIVMALSEKALAFLSRLNGDNGESIEQLAKYLLYGVEIEFSECGDLSNGSNECPYTEDDAACSLNHQGSYLLLSCWGCRYTDDTRLIADTVLNNAGSLESAINNATNTHWSDLVDNELESMQSAWEPDDDSFGFRDVDGWEHCEDGTSGIVQEYKTDSPCDQGDLISRVEHLLGEAGDECCVPLNGSCHIHVSIPGCKHTATHESELHACVLWELSQRVSEFPERVMERLLKDSSYFRLDNNPQDKYSAVHFHHQGTVEFRLFGAMNDPDDIAVCVRIAGESFIRGYHRFTENRCHNLNPGQMRKLFRLHVLRGESIPAHYIESTLLSVLSDGMVYSPVSSGRLDNLAIPTIDREDEDIVDNDTIADL
jgi:hypothetical protein